jgi:molybdopterin converting factor small subunit
MSNVTIRIPTPLRSFTAGAGEVAVDAATVGEALELLGLRHDGILDRILDADGQVRGFVNIYVGEKSIRSLDGLRSPVGGSSVISIVPAVAGGGSRGRL